MPYSSTLKLNVETGDEPLYRVQVTATDGLEKWVELYTVIIVIELAIRHEARPPARARPRASPRRYAARVLVLGMPSVLHAASSERRL